MDPASQNKILQAVLFATSTANSTSPWSSSASTSSFPNISPTYTIRRIDPIPSAAQSTPPPRQGTIPTRIALISDTHAVTLFPAIDRKHCYRAPLPKADVLIHAGDLTNHGSIRQHEVTFKVLAEADAELKLVIAGNHDKTLDLDYQIRRCSEGVAAADRTKAAQEAQERCREAKELWSGDSAKESGIIYLEEGVHSFELKNGAKFTVYASPYSPEFCDWAFMYPRSVDRYNSSRINSPEESSIRFTVPASSIPSFPAIDIIITHGPPHGFRDQLMNGERVGCESLLKAVRRTRPRLHVCGHIHEAWGAERVDWVEGESKFLGGSPFDNEIMERGYMKVDMIGNGEAQVVAEEARSDVAQEDCEEETGVEPLRWGEETLFVNAAIMSGNFRPTNAPWVVDLMLPAKGGDDGTSDMTL